VDHLDRRMVHIGLTLKKLSETLTMFGDVI